MEQLPVANQLRVPVALLLLSVVSLLSLLSVVSTLFVRPLLSWRRGLGQRLRLFVFILKPVDEPPRRAVVVVAAAATAAAAPVTAATAAPRRAPGFDCRVQLRRRANTI